MASPREYSGVVQPGRGLGTSRMAGAGLSGRLRDLLGFPVVAGTLNVQLPGPFDRPVTMLHLAATDIHPDWAEETGQDRYFFAPVTIADGYRGAAMQAQEPGYPADQVELVCEVHLRTTLGLTDGDTISFTVLNG